MTRRHLLAGSALALSGFAAIFSGRRMEAHAETFEVVKTDEEWKALLTQEQYAVLRHEATEYAFSSPLNNEKRAGTFACAGCDLPLYSSTTKFDSGTGWPSFWDAMPDAIRTKEDRSLFSVRTEVHCRRCGGHLGHIFHDGPAPTAKRHSINRVSLKFMPDAKAS